MGPNILVINPGSTTDRVSYFRGVEEVFTKSVDYSTADLKPYESQSVTSQYDMRKEFVLRTLHEAKIDLSEIEAVIGRGGLLKPIESGTYAVNDAMVEDLRKGLLGDHPSSLGGLIAKAIADPLGIPSFIADPVVVDELEPLARYSGMPENPRISIFHALNHKAVARRAATQLGKKYEECNFIVFHGGGGITVGAHKKGRVVDVNNGLDGDGPFTPQRSGSVPVGKLVEMCASEEYSPLQIKLMIKGQGGLVAFTGTSDCKALEKVINGECLTQAERKNLLRTLTPASAKEAIEAMCYQVAKEVCSLAAVFPGPPDAIILTGGLARNERVINLLKARIGWLAPVMIFPGGDEMTALRDAASRVIRGDEKARIYD